MSNYKTFLEHYRQKEIALLESPMRLGRHFGDDLDNNMFNVESAKEIINQHNFITKQTPVSPELSLYREPYDAIKFQDYWITAQPFIGCFFIFQIEKDGVSSLGVWNHKQYKGSARELLFSYYLKHYSFIISDNKHSDQGEDYWKKVIKQATNLGHKVTVITRDNKEFDIDDVDAYWGNSSSFSEYRIKIYKI
jgi:hypothetical protein